MRIQLISDLHIDVRAGYVPVVAEGVDVVVVAGDVCEGVADGMAFLRAHIPLRVPIVLVAGNHEYYHRTLTEERVAAVSAARAHAITLLDDEACVIGGVRFVGATLWTDFALYGEDQRQTSMVLARQSVNDFKCIRYDAASPRLFTPKRAVELHRASIAFIEQAMAQGRSGPTLVLTHHAPHRLSIDPRFAGDTLTPAFVSDLGGLIERLQPDLWLHGHVHSSFDYRVGATRVVCNPKGYGRENRKFDAALTIEI